MSPKTSAITISLRRHYPYQVQWFPLASDLSLSAPTIYSCWYHYIRPAPPCQAICANTAAHEPSDRTCYLRSQMTIATYLIHQSAATIENNPI